MMPSFFRPSYFIPLSFVALLITACFNIPIDNLDPNEFVDSNLVPTVAPTLGSSPTFQNDVIPAFASASCTNSGCHGNGSVQASGSNPPGLNFQIGDGAPSGQDEDTAEFLYQYLLGNRGNTVYADTGSAQNSFILTYPQSGGSSHAGGANAWGGVSSTEYQTVLSWIQAGAPF